MMETCDTFSHGSMAYDERKVALKQYNKEKETVTETGLAN